MSFTTVESRIAGTVGMVLLIAGALLLFDRAGAPPNGSYEVTAILGDAGTGMFTGGDVKVRDVIIGSIKTLELRDGRAVATLVLDPEPTLPADVRILVTDKTVLGEKQVELLPPSALSEGPRLQAGATLTVDPELQPVPFQDVIADAEDVLAAIDGEALARIVAALGSFGPDDARLVGRNIELLDELTAFSARTAEAQVERFRAMADLFETLEPATDDINRLNRTLPTWGTLLPDRQAEIRAGLESLERFSDRFAAWLEIERPAFRQFFQTGEAVGAVLDPRMEQISRYVYGVYRYAFSLGNHGGNLNDGTEHAWFRVFTAPEELQALCAALPEAFRANAPGCLPGGGSS